MRKPVKMTVPGEIDERRLLRGRLLVHLHATITRMLMDISPGLTLDEMLVREAVYIADHKQEECDLDHIVRTVGISKTSAARKLEKLVSMGLIEKKKRGRKFVFFTPQKYLSARYEYDDGRPVIDNAVDEIVELVDRLVR